LAKDALMHDVTDARLFCRIDKSLALDEHVHGVPGQQEQPVYPSEGSSERLRVVQIEMNRLFAGGSHRFDVGLFAGGETEADVAGVTVELCHDKPPRLAGRADDKDRRLLILHIFIYYIWCSHHGMFKNNDLDDVGPAHDRG